MATLTRFVRFALPIALLLTAAIGVPVKVLDSQGIERVKRLRKELETLEEDNAKMRRENEALKREIRSFHSDPSYIERVARDELGMVGPDEVIYQFPDSR